MDLLRAQLVEQTLAAAPKPLGQLFNPDFSVIPTCLVLPYIPAGVNYVAPTSLLAHIPKFCGLPVENALHHIKSFAQLCVTQNEHVVGQDAYRLRVFPLTLAGQATNWLDSLAPNSIITWTELQTKFF